jgi:hypothetical protein
MALRSAGTQWAPSRKGRDLPAMSEIALRSTLRPRRSTGGRMHEGARPDRRRWLEYVTMALGPVASCRSFRGRGPKEQRPPAVGAVDLLPAPGRSDRLFRGDTWPSGPRETHCGQLVGCRHDITPLRHAPSPSVRPRDCCHDRPGLTGAGRHTGSCTMTQPATAG